SRRSTVPPCSAARRSGRTTPSLLSLNGRGRRGSRPVRHLIAGLLHGGGDQGGVDGAVAVHGQQAGGEVHLDVLDSGHLAHLFLDRADAVAAGHALHGERGRAHIDLSSSLSVGARRPGGGADRRHTNYTPLWYLRYP